MGRKIHKVASQLLQEVLALPGEKILTLATLDGSFTVDIDEKGKIGYEVGVEQLLLAKLVRAMREGGGMIVRQFLPFKLKRKMSNGKTLWVPEKNIYAAALGADQWFGCTAEQAESFCNTNAETGEAISPEEGVHYRAFPSALMAQGHSN